MLRSVPRARAGDGPGRATRSGSCSRPTSSRASRCRRSRTPRWTATRCAPPTPRARPRPTPVRLHVVGDLPAGHAPTVPVGPGEAIRIMTGAPIPTGADAIVMVERTERDGDDGVRISAGGRARPARPRPPAATSTPATQVFDAGTVLGPAHLGVLVRARARPRSRSFPRARVGVISTGDELREGPVELAPGQIRDSNRPMLLALVAERGRRAGRPRDRPRRRGRGRPRCSVTRLATLRRDRSRAAACRSATTTS